MFCVEVFFGGARAAGAVARPGAVGASGHKVPSYPPDRHNARADCISVQRSGHHRARQGGAAGTLSGKTVSEDATFGSGVGRLHPPHVACEP